MKFVNYVQILNIYSHLGRTFMWQLRQPMQAAVYIEVAPTNQDKQQQLYAYFEPTTSPVMSLGVVLEKLDTSPMMASMAALSWVAFWKSDMLPHSRVAWTQ